MVEYIWQAQDWPNFRWDETGIAEKLQRIRHKQGNIGGRVEALGFKQREKMLMDTLTSDIVKSSEIEGQVLDPEAVRSSVARRLGISYEKPVMADRNVEGVVHIALDAALNPNERLSDERLFQWHAALFPTGRDEWGRLLTVGKWRDDKLGPMTVQDGPAGRERIYYVAPPASQVPQEVERFQSWFEDRSSADPLMKASVAHLWFVAIHPFDDGNGRITRNICDLALARADYNSMRFYSMSTQLKKEQKGYYAALEATTKYPRTDLTEWNRFFLDCLEKSIDSTSLVLDNVLRQTRFWEHHRGGFNDRQIKMIGRIFDGFEGKVTTEKWSKITKSSTATAGRDLEELVKRGVLRVEGVGRGTHYILIEEPEGTAGAAVVVPGTQRPRPELTPGMARILAEKAYGDAMGWLSAERAKIVEQIKPGLAAVQKASSTAEPQEARFEALRDAARIQGNVLVSWSNVVQEGREIARQLARDLEDCRPYDGDRLARFNDELGAMPEAYQGFVEELSRVKSAVERGAGAQQTIRRSNGPGFG